MTHIAYVAAGWGITAVTIGVYAVRTIRRGRAVAPRVPHDQRRWG